MLISEKVELKLDNFHKILANITSVEGLYFTGIFYSKIGRLTLCKVYYHLNVEMERTHISELNVTVRSSEIILVTCLH